MSETEWGLQYGEDIYLMDEVSAREVNNEDLVLVWKLPGGEWEPVPDSA